MSERISDLGKLSESVIKDNEVLKKELNTFIKKEEE